MNSPTIALAADDQFALTLNGHTLLIPCTPAGLRALRRILRDHEQAPAAKIGAASNPVQHMVEQWLRTNAREKAKAASNPAQHTSEQWLQADADEKVEAVASISLEELGL